MPFPVYLDADVHPVVARILRGRGFDVLSANETGHPQASDREQLDFAVARSRALVTFNVADFVREARGYANEDRDHYGIIDSDQLEVGRARAPADTSPRALFLGGNDQPIRLAAFLRVAWKDQADGLLSCCRLSCSRFDQLTRA